MKIANASRAILASVALAVAGPVIGAEKEKDKDQEKLSAMDKAFMEMVAMNDMTEIKLAKAAQEKATSEQLKQHAAKMIEDHTKTSTELKQLAKQKDVDLKEELPAAKKAMIEEITSKSGGDFDKAYMDHEIAGHRMAQTVFQNGAEFAKDPQVQQFAQKYLPVIEQHRSMVDPGGKETTQRQSGQERGGATAGAGGTARPSGTQGTQGGAGQQQQQQSGQVRTE